MMNHVSSTTKNCQAPTKPAFREVDLQLPITKLPLDVNELNKNYRIGTVEDLCGELYAIGSSCPNELVYQCQLGIFECVKEAWENHWNLRTSPEDWWFPVACRIAQAIEQGAKPSSWYSAEVRELFVSHEEKENIVIEQNIFHLHEMDADSLFSSFSSEIERRIKVPQFAAVMQNDFSTTTPAQKIASQINLMASMQEFFTYEFRMCGCGIKGLEMLGSQADWDALVTKLQQIRNFLEPISSSIRLSRDWFDHVEYVYKNLAKTFSEPGSSDVASFWADVLCDGYGTRQYGGSNMMKEEVEAYNGWLAKFLLDSTVLHKEYMSDSKIQEKLRGLNSVPMKLSFTYVNPPVSDKGTLVAGIMGFTVLQARDTFNEVPSVAPYHVWALKLSTDSPLRR